MPLSTMANGTKLAIGIILLWFGGACLFVAFMSGKVPSLTSAGGDGPKDAADLVVQIAQATQTAESGTG